MKPILLILACTFFLVACSNNKAVHIQIEHKLKSNPPSSISYEVTNKEILVKLHQKKLPFGKKETSYSKSLNAKQIDDLIKFLEVQKLDTLKANYKENVGEDLITSSIQINQKGKPTIKCLLENTSVTAADNLYNYIDNLIDNSQFKLGKIN
ncbi:MAG: hypothetical protein ACOVMM_07600 [Chitinophagaceae bacterium]